jgi:hypothetical protein
MNSKSTQIGLAVLVALAGATYFVYREPPPSTNAALTAPWSAWDKGRVDNVTINRPGAAADARELRFEKQGTSWSMTAPGRGPTAENSVQDLLNRLSDMHVVSRRATQAASHTQFNIDDAHGTRITLKAGGTVLLDLVVGDAVGAGTSVRRPGANEVFEADQSLSSMLSQQPRDWRNREITRVERGQVTRVEWVNPNGTFTFTRSGETWTPATPIERLDTARVGAVVDSLLNLRASDFAAANATTGFTDSSPRVTLTTGGGDAAAQTLILRAGATGGDNEVYLRREGSDITYLVSRASGDAVNPALTAFQQPLPQDGGAASDASAPAPEAAPGGAPGAPPGGSPQIPPEVMEQLRRQLQNAGGAAPH